MSTTSCLSIPSSTSNQYTLSAVSQLSVPTSTTQSFVKRGNNGTSSFLEVDGNEFKVVGPNVYWLGLDENVNSDNSPSYPSKSRILEIMAVAKVMGATTIRSTSLGVSVGTGLSIGNALNTFKPADSIAWDTIDFAVFAARSYGLRLIIPLTDQYDYYHGGIPTFLRWRKLPDDDFKPFYDLESQVYQDFQRYIENLLTHVSPYTNLTLATDPTILAFETGNELGGWTGTHFPPPVEWTKAISRYLKELANETLVLSGSYGVREDELGIETIDIHSDHFYPTYTSRLTSSSNLANSASKPFLVGEYDWTNQYYLRYRWTCFSLLIPVVIALGVWALPKKWWPWKFTLRSIGTCGCCCRQRRRRKRTDQVQDGDSQGQDRRVYDRMSRGTSDSNELLNLDEGITKLRTNESTTSIPILSSTLPPDTSKTIHSSPPRTERQRTRTTSKILDYPLRIPRWLFSLFIFLLILPLFGIIYTYLPTPFPQFLSKLSSLEKASNPGGDDVKAIGDSYWSLFGKDDECCQYVQHDDGYTLHYPSDPSSSSMLKSSRGSGQSVLELTKHAWKVRNEIPFWASTTTSTGVFEWDQVGFEDLPIVACPQEGLRLGNGTIVGGSS